MQLTIDRTALLKALAHAQGIVERRNTIPILSNVLLQAGQGGLTVTASDMEIELVETLPADVAQPGAITVPAAMLYEIVRKLPEGAEVELAAVAGKDQVTVKAGRSTFKLGTLPVDDFPQLVVGDLPCTFQLDAGSLILLLDRTKFAMSGEDSRYYLNGIYFHATTSGSLQVLRTVTTDGHRLARMEVPLPAGGEAMPPMILPRKSVMEIRKLLEEGQGDVTLAIAPGKARLTIGSLVLTTKLVDGRFPDYERAIPTGNDKVLQINCKAFAEGVDRVSTISSEKTRGVRLTIEPGSLCLSATRSDAPDRAEEELEVGYDSDPMQIGYNGRYLLEILQQIDSETVQIKLADSGSPSVVSAAGENSALYVLMPMRV